MSVIAYQQKGRDHIRYINRRAHTAWEKYGYKDEKWAQVLRETLRDHVKYLEDADRINKLVEERENQKKIIKPKEKEASMWWRNAMTGEWEPLVV